MKGIGLIDDLIRRPPYLYKRIERFVGYCDGKSTKELEAVIDEELETILRKASMTFYGQSIGGSRDILAWPLLEKEMVRGCEKDFVMNRAGLKIQANTGGSTGIPLKLVRSWRSVVAEQVYIDRLLQCEGKAPEKLKMAVLRGDTIKDPADFRLPFWRYINFGKKLLLSSHHLNEVTIIEYIKELNRFRPDCLFAYPSALHALCALAKDLSENINISLVVTSSEVLPLDIRQMAIDVLGCKIIDHYGVAERVAFASSTDGENYYFGRGYSNIELKKASMEDQYDLYEIIGTTLWNEAMPLVRYRTGDLIRLSKGMTDEAIRMVSVGALPFKGIVGRETDYLLSPEGVKLVGMNHLPRALDHVAQMQVIQQDVFNVTILIVPANGYGDEDKLKIIESAYKKLPNSMRVEVHSVDRLVRTATGKIPFIIRENGRIEENPSCSSSDLI